MIKIQVAPGNRVVLASKAIKDLSRDAFQKALAWSGVVKEVHGEWAIVTTTEGCTARVPMDHLALVTPGGLLEAA